MSKLSCTQLKKCIKDLVAGQRVKQMNTRWTVIIYFYKIKYFQKPNKKRQFFIIVRTIWVKETQSAESRGKGEKGKKNTSKILKNSLFLSISSENKVLCFLYTCLLSIGNQSFIIFIYQFKGSECDYH